MLSDSGGPAQSAESVLAIYHPYREKRTKCEGYDIRQLRDRARIPILLDIFNFYWFSNKFWHDFCSIYTCFKILNESIKNYYFEYIEPYTSDCI